MATPLAAFPEWEVRRNGKPILFGLGAMGPTWADEEFFLRRDINKLGQELELFWNGKLIDKERKSVTKLVAHWRKHFNRRMKTTGLPLETWILTCPWETSDFHE